MISNKIYTFIIILFIGVLIVYLNNIPPTVIIRKIPIYDDEINNDKIPPKVLNISYTQKYKLSDIAKLIDKDINLDILVKESSHNYSGSAEKIDSLKMNLDGLEASLKDYYNEVKYA